jgi:hypothetical protein
LINLPLSKYRRKRILVSGSLHNDSSVVVSVNVFPDSRVVWVVNEEEEEGAVNSSGRRRPERREARIEGLTS